MFGDPDKRIIKMLGARGSHVAAEVAAEVDAEDGKAVAPAA